MKPEHTTQTEYLFVHFPETIQDILMLANVFINEGKTIEVYPSADKLGKQFSYADKKGIPHVVVFGEGEKALKRYKIKNMKTGEEKEISL
jgi:histidyl-tRNA synthetase